MSQSCSKSVYTMCIATYRIVAITSYHIGTIQLVKSCKGLFGLNLKFELEFKFWYLKWQTKFQIKKFRILMFKK